MAGSTAVATSPGDNLYEYRSKQVRPHSSLIAEVQTSVVSVGCTCQPTQRDLV